MRVGPYALRTDRARLPDDLLGPLRRRINAVGVRKIGKHLGTSMATLEIILGGGFVRTATVQRLEKVLTQPEQEPAPES